MTHVFENDYNIDDETLYTWLKDPQKNAYSIMKVLPDDVKHQFTQISAAEYPINRQTSMRCSIYSALTMYNEKCKYDELKVEPYFNNMLHYGRKLVIMIDQTLIGHNNDLITKEAGDEIIFLEIQNLTKVIKQLDKKLEDVKPILNKDVIQEYDKLKLFVSELRKGCAHQMRLRDLLKRIQKSIDTVLGYSFFELSMVEPPLKTILHSSQKNPILESLPIESTEIGYSIKKELIRENTSYKFEHDDQIYEIKKNAQNAIEIKESNE